MRLPRPPWVLIAGLAAALTVGCGSEAPAPPAPRPARADIVHPAALGATCERIARTAELPVLCPPDLADASAAAATSARERAVPAAQRLEVIHEDLEPDPCAYLVNVSALDAAPDGALASHVLLGGRCGLLPLPPAGERLPMDPPDSLRLVANPPLQSGQDPTQLALRRPVVLRSVSVRGRPGVLVRADPRPEGGLHGGHFALVWNEGGRGYVASAHYPGGDRGAAPRAVELRALGALAEGLRAAG